MVNMIVFLLNVTPIAVYYKLTQLHCSVMI